MATYNPQGSGRAERMVRTLKNSVGKMIQDKLGEWDRALFPAIHGYRVRETREKPSPYELLFGVKPRLPPFDEPPSLQVIDADHRQLEIAHVATIREERKQEGSSNIKPKFAFGDLVLMAHSQDREKKNRKMALRWDGPYLIVDSHPPSYKLQEANGRVSRKYICERRLRRYIAGTAQSRSTGLLGEYCVTRQVDGEPWKVVERNTKFGRIINQYDRAESAGPL